MIEETQLLFRKMILPTCLTKKAFKMMIEVLQVN